MATRRRLTRWDLWAIPGPVLMLAGFVLELSSVERSGVHKIGMLLVAVGTFVHLGFVLWRQRRDNRAQVDYPRRDAS